MFRLTMFVLIFLEMVVAPAIMLWENSNQRKRAEELENREALLVIVDRRIAADLKTWQSEREALRQYHEYLMCLTAELNRRQRAVAEAEKRLGKAMAVTHDERNASDEQPIRNLIDFQWDAKEAFIPQRWND